MKKVLIGLAIAATAFGANAQHTSNSMIRGHGWQGPQHHHARGNNWIIPALIGGAVVYAATRPPVVEQQIIIQQPSVDVVYINGIAYRKQVMLVNGQYQEVLVRL
jgi:hypothetical protein